MRGESRGRAAAPGATRTGEAAVVARSGAVRAGLPAPIAGAALGLCVLAVAQVLIVIPAVRTAPHGGALPLVGLIFHPLCLVLLCWWAARLTRRDARVRRRLTRFLPVLAVVGTTIVVAGHAGRYYLALAGAVVVLILLVLALLWLPVSARRFLGGDPSRSRSR